MLDLLVFTSFYKKDQIPKNYRKTIVDCIHKSITNMLSIKKTHSGNSLHVRGEDQLLFNC